MSWALNDCGGEDVNMKRLNEKCRCLCRDFAGIHLVDKCLIIFMAVLLAQSAFSLAAGEAWAARANDVDVIVRTAAASIFGYFLSANFINRGLAGEEERRQGEVSGVMEVRGESLEAQPQREVQEDEPQREVREALLQPENQRSSLLPDREAEARLQILVASGIGLFCLAALILLRNIGGYTGGTLSATAAATVTQFRDFVSGCVGFLIGCPTSRGN